MKMEGEIISRENMIPSSPTSPEKRIHKLSLFDQITAPVFAPMVLYYPNLKNIPTNVNADFISQTTQHLKQSLSQTLTRFYPLAGRIRDALSVDCNDQGVPFVVAKFDTNLSDFLENPDPLACRAHLPAQENMIEPGPGSNVAAIQVNYFPCGGIAIGSLFYHKIADGVTIGAFTKTWAATAAGGGDGLEETAAFPDYDAQSRFPQKESMQRDSHLFSIMRNYFKMGKTVMRRYVFDASAIAKLRARVLSASPDRRPSRVEIVSALMWKCFMDASSNKSSSIVSHGVNMRRKADPPFPDNSFGNFVWLMPAASSTNNGTDEEPELRHLLSKLRRAIGKVDEDFVKGMQGDEGFSNYCKNQKEIWNVFSSAADADYLSMVSWCNFGLYGIDFGWGKPMWITKCDGGSDGAETPYMNALWLMDTREGDGVEAWLTLDQNYFDELDKSKMQDHLMLLHLASVDPSPLHAGTYQSN